MNGGVISGNSARSIGGGVFVSDGTFTMNGGEISGNTASSSGGGVFIRNATEIRVDSSSPWVTTFVIFEKIGGTIYGYDNNNPDALSNNKVEKDGNILNGKGHAVYGFTGPRYKDTTLGEDEDLVYNTTDGIYTINGNPW
jgi:hypothetical protein